MNHHIRSSLFVVIAVLAASVGRAEASTNAMKSHFSILQDSFVSPDYQMTKEKSFNYLRAEVKSESEKNHRDHLDMDVAGLYAPGQSALNYINVAELAYTTGDGSNSSISFGRKREPWSLLEDQWTLGLYQPVFKWNPLQPSQQGLSGLYAAYSADAKWGFSLFGSSLFLPNQGPSYEIKDGRFQPANPYFTRPPQYAVLHGKRVNINYELQKPEVSDVVFNKSFAARFYIGDPDKGLFAQAAAANKPSNDLALGFRGYFELISKTGEGRVTAKTFYHTVNSADIRYSFENLWFSYGVIQDRPQQPEFSPEWTYVTYSDSVLHGPTVGLKGARWSLAASTLYVSEGAERAFGDDAAEATNYSPHRFSYGSAYQLEFKMDRKLARAQKIVGTTKYMRGLEGEFQLWLATLQYQLSSQWLVGAELQAVNTTNSEKAQRTVFYGFENNDSVGLGLTYVF